MLDGRLGFLGRRQIMVDQWLAHLWHYIVYRSLFLGYLDGLISPGEFLATPWDFRRHRWGGQGWQSMDPSRETKARVEGTQNDVEALTEGLEERGIDLDDHLRRREFEKMQMVEQEVRVRKRKWELEEQAGLPHQEEVASEEDSDPEEQQVEQETAA